MAIETGLNWAVAIDTADVADPVGGAPNWVELPNQQVHELNLTRNDAEANHKGNAGWTTSLTISRGATVTFSGFTDPNDGALLFLYDTKAMGVATDATINVRLKNNDGDTFIGIYALADFTPEAAPFDGIVEYSGTFNSRGAPTLTRS